MWTDASIQTDFTLIFKEPGRDLAWCPPDELRAKRRTCPSPACEPWACLKVRNAVQSDAICISRIGTNNWGNFNIWVCLKMLCTPLYPMVLLIIIPMNNGYFIGKINPTFSDKAISSPSPFFGTTSWEFPKVKPGCPAGPLTCGFGCTRRRASSGGSTDHWRKLGLGVVQTFLILPMVYQLWASHTNPTTMNISCWLMLIVPTVGPSGTCAKVWYGTPWCLVSGLLKFDACRHFAKFPCGEAKQYLLVVVSLVFNHLL